MMLIKWLRNSRFFPCQPLLFFLTCIVTRTILRRFSLNIFFFISCHDNLFMVMWKKDMWNLTWSQNFALIPFIWYKWKFAHSIIFHFLFFLLPQRPYFRLDRSFLPISCICNVRKLIACEFRERFCDVLA